MKKIILASNSPRRRELLALMDLPFEVFPADLDESQYEGELPKIYVRRMASEKAEAIAKEKSGLIVAADTIVVYQEEILGKPENQFEARGILTKLRGKIHQVYTGIAIIDTISGQTWDDICCTEVPMREYSDAEIDAYVATGDPMDKAGAYGIQHVGFRPVDHLAGCYASVMGMPLCHLAVGLVKPGMEVNFEIAERCQQYLGYKCPIWESILEQGLQQ